MSFTGNEKLDRQISALVLGLAGLSQLNVLGNLIAPIYAIGFMGVTLGMASGVLLVWYAYKAMKTGKVTGRAA